MVKFQFSKQKTKSAEKISQQVFYIMIGLAVLVFGLFFLVGYDLPFEENPDFNAPLFTDVLILLMWLFLIEGTGLAVFSMIRDYRSSKSEAVVNGIPVRRIFRITWIGTLAVFAAYLLFGRFCSDAHQWRELCRLALAQAFRYVCHHIAPDAGGRNRCRLFRCHTLYSEEKLK